MKKLMTLLSLMLLASPLYADDISTIQSMLAGTKIQSIKPTPVNGIYEVHAGKNIFYVDKTAHYAFFGHLYDLVNAKDLTRLPNTMPDISHDDKINWSSLPLDSAIITGNPKGVPIAVFIDPECPFCLKLESGLLRSNQFKVYQFLLPLDELHPESSLIANQLRCAIKPDKAFTDYFLNHTPPPATSSDCDSLLNQIADVAERNHIQGTPVIIRGDGTVHFGYLPMNELFDFAKGQ